MFYNKEWINIHGKIWIQHQISKWWRRPLATARFILPERVLQLKIHCDRKEFFDVALSHKLSCKSTAIRSSIFRGLNVVDQFEVCWGAKEGGSMVRTRLWWWFGVDVEVGGKGVVIFRRRSRRWFVGYGVPTRWLQTTVEGVIQRRV